MRSRSEQHLTNLLTEKILRIIDIQSQNLKEKKHNMAAKVIKEKCIACGACVDGACVGGTCGLAKNNLYVITTASDRAMARNILLSIEKTPFAINWGNSKLHDISTPS